MDSNACRARKVERKVWRDNDFLLSGKLLKMSPLVIGRFRCVNPAKARGSGAVSLLALEQLSSEVGCNRGRIAQFPEQLTLNQRVAGSSPATPTKQSRPRCAFTPNGTAALKVRAIPAA